MNAVTHAEADFFFFHASNVFIYDVWGKLDADADDMLRVNNK